MRVFLLFFLIYAKLTGGCCKERSDGIAIVTLASIASKVRRDLARFSFY